jgi:3-oxoacyl-[acyl-carrier protein] reductase
VGQRPPVGQLAQEGTHVTDSSVFSGMKIPGLAGKRVLVTGASTGIGAAVARALANQGVGVAVHYNKSETEARKLVAEIEAAGGKVALIGGDVAAPGGSERVVEEAARELDGLDGLINNAGSMLGRMPIADMSEEHYGKVMDLNARSVLSSTRAALPWLRRNGGFVINTTSIAARHGGGGGATLYAAAKGFVSTITRGHAKELAGERIRVNAVAPGVIATPFHDRYSTAEQMEAMAKTVPQGRVGTPEDCVGAFLFLASDVLSGYVTGQVIEVNGGQLMP